MITIKEIAKLANVSDGTVDRVIHNRGGVSKKTEEKIKKILKEYNFILNPIASALASKKKYLISCLIPKYSEKNQFWRSPYLGILKAQDEVKSYGVQIRNYFFDQFNPRSYLKIFSEVLEEKPNVVILAPIFNKETKSITDQLDTLDIPYMFININREGFNNISFIGPDSHMAGYVAGKLMSLSLPENSACIVAQTRANITDHNAIANRIEGFKKYIKNHNIKIDILALKIDLNDLVSEKEKINNYLEAHPKVRGVFVPSSRVSNVARIFYKSYPDSSFTFIGYDTTEDNVKELKKNKIQFLISQRSFNQGYEAIRMMSDFLVLKKIPEGKIYSPIQVILKENVDFDNRYKKTQIKTLENNIIDI